MTFQGMVGQDEASLVNEIRKAADGSGAFLVTGHGIDESIWPTIQATGAKLFDMPLSEKNALKCPPAPRGTEMQAGYVKYGYQQVGREKLAAVSIGDLGGKGAESQRGRTPPIMLE